jgi:hypothetical protein
MHPTISVKPPKATTSPDKPTADQQFFINILASFTANLDKKIEPAIDRKLGKEENIEMKKDKIDDDEDDEKGNQPGDVEKGA